MIRRHSRYFDRCAPGVLGLALVLFGGCNFIGKLGGASGDKGGAEAPAANLRCEGREFCDDTSTDPEARDAAKAACEAYQKCLATVAVDDPQNLGAAMNRGGSLGSGPADEARCDAVQECPHSPTGNHIFKGETPPKYMYTVDKDGACWKQEKMDCSVCGTTYCGYAPKIKIGHNELRRSRAEAFQKSNDANAAYQRAMADGVTGDALFAFQWTAEVARQYYTVLFGAYDTAETFAIDHDKPFPCAPME